MRRGEHPAACAMVVEYKRYKREKPEGWSEAYMAEVVQCMIFKVRDFETVRRGVATMKAACDAKGYVQEARNLAWVVELLQCAHPTHLPGLYARVHEPDPSSDSEVDEHHAGTPLRTRGCCHERAGGQSPKFKICACVPARIPPCRGPCPYWHREWACLLPGPGRVPVVNRTRAVVG